MANQMVRYVRAANQHMKLPEICHKV